MQQFAIVAALAVLMGCAGSGSRTAEPIRKQVVEIAAMRAKVSAIDRQQRRVTLVDVAGSETVFYADEEVRNFEQIQVGDEVVGERIEAILLEVRPPTPEEAAGGASILQVVATAKPGQRPAGLFVHEITAVLSIDAIDRQASTATLRGPSGVPRVVRVANPANLDRVRVGDDVVVTYTEALRLVVREPGMAVSE
jgi:hypothetical protein